MNEAQLIAIQHHCRMAFETAHHRFIRYLERPKASVILSVNSGYE